VLRHERAQLLILARVPRPPVHGVPILVAALTGRAHTRGSDSREGTRGGDGRSREGSFEDERHLWMRQECQELGLVSFIHVNTHNT
jgi:hypothetical protein